MKNTNAIDKIISELAMKDYLQDNPKKADESSYNFYLTSQFGGSGA